MKSSEKVRLQKFLADCGVASRRKSEQMIIDGMVRVNGVMASIGDKVDPIKDKVTLNNKRISMPKESKYYIMLHKPRGYITTMNDEQNRKCVADLIKDINGNRVIQSIIQNRSNYFDLKNRLISYY